MQKGVFVVRFIMLTLRLLKLPLIFFSFAVLFYPFFSCTGKSDRCVVLATTTSLHDTGLLEKVIQMFEQKTKIKVKPLVVGSGQAFALGKRGDVDILLVHDPSEENVFLKQGYGIARYEICYNDFYIVGPSDDPALVRSAPTAEEAMLRIYEKGVPFISRGDNSGTHKMEQRLWETIRVNPKDKSWYLQTGLGMGQTLLFADEKGGYTLADYGTFKVLDNRLTLVPLWGGGGRLMNIYSVILVNPVRFPNVNAEGARKFAFFLKSEEVKEFIDRYGKDRHGVAMYHPFD